VADTLSVYADFRLTPPVYFTTSSSSASSPPNSTRKRSGECSDSIRSMGLAKDHEFNARWLREARRVLKADGTLWVTGTHHIIFSIGFALQKLGYRIINQIAWQKPDPPPNALHTAFTHSHQPQGRVICVIWWLTLQSQTRRLLAQAPPPLAILIADPSSTSRSLSDLDQVATLTKGT
jgi:hypothetical protein